MYSLAHGDGFTGNMCQTYQSARLKQVQFTVSGKPRKAVKRERRKTSLSSAASITCLRMEGRKGRGTEGSHGPHPQAAMKPTQSTLTPWTLDAKAAGCGPHCLAPPSGDPRACLCAGAGHGVGGTFGEIRSLEALEPEPLRVDTNVRKHLVRQMLENPLE